MDVPVQNGAAGTAARRFGDHPCWYLLLLGLFLWQGWLTYGLFGNLKSLGDDRPLVSGCHPLHLYFGWLGTSSFYETGKLQCFDPAFQAGFPKTPVFDSGSRPAELFIVLDGGSCASSAYKLGLAMGCLLVPGVLWLGCRAAGLDRSASGIAVALGLVIWWGQPGRSALEAGDLDLLFGTISAIAYLGYLIGFHRRPSLGSTLGLLGAGSLVWFFHPILLILLFPVLLIYYLSVGRRHSLGWHGVLLACQIGALALNSFWLLDWLSSWWLRLPLHLDEWILTHRTIRSFWNSSLCGEPTDRILAVTILGLAVVGVNGLNQCRQRATARVFGCAAGGLLVLAGFGMVLPQLGRLGTANLLLPALWFAVIPAVFCLVAIVHGASSIGHRAWAVWRERWGAGGVVSIACALAALSALVLVYRPVMGRRGWGVGQELEKRLLGTPRFLIGLSPEQEDLIEIIRKCTTTQARIMWEERPCTSEASRWTALLPRFTGRVFIGGLGPDVPIEHTFVSLMDQNLAGRPITDWSDVELDNYCRRYNIGWVVGWSPATIARFRAWNGAQPLASINDGSTGVFFSLKPHSFILKGQAQWLHADGRRITLANVVPEDGKVVLSLHYHAGMQV